MEKVSVSWHAGRSDVGDVIMATCCGMQLGMDCLEPEWPELLPEISQPMAEYPQSSSQQGTWISYSDDRRHVGGPFRRRCLPSKGNFAWKIVRLHEAMTGQGG